MINLTITNAKEVLFHGQAKCVTVPGAHGEMTIYKDHTPLVSPLKIGMVTIHEDGMEKSFSIESGLIEVSPDEVLILV